MLYKSKHSTNMFASAPMPQTHCSGCISLRGTKLGELGHKLCRMCWSYKSGRAVKWDQHAGLGSPFIPQRPNKHHIRHFRTARPVAKRAFTCSALSSAHVKAAKVGNSYRYCCLTCSALATGLPGKTFHLLQSSLQYRGGTSRSAVCRAS